MMRFARSTILRKGFWRGAAFFSTTAIALLGATIQSAQAQSIDVVRDTEIERVLRSYEVPILKAAGLDPDTVHLFLVQDPEINAFATQSPIAGNEEDIFVNTGTFMQLTRPNQIIGILAHETGHIAGGHIVRDAGAIQKASIPMLIGMAVGIAAMAMGAGEAGMGAIQLGQQAALSQFLAFSRVQEATADQMGVTFLNRTHQSARGMVEVFEKFANENARSAYYNKDFVSDHPADRERIDALQQRVEASPYKDVPDTPENIKEFHMIQAKLAGFLSKPDDVLIRYPLTDQSDEAHYARAMAYFRQPDMKKALAETNALIATNPKNPYFWELLGQIYVEMSQPRKGVAPYQKSVDLMPDAPLLRVSLAAAQLATEIPALTQPALDNLKIALVQENNNSFAWYETAQAYSDLGNKPMADLATAELHYQGGDMRGAAHFAQAASLKLAKGSTDWQHANDILAAAAAANAQAKQR
ncbi:MAG: M48 family metallopeptidase [Proteobacteria bacterium]|nr:M48 family metallopeptidase [Pseudomonadota bacterium]